MAGTAIVNQVLGSYNFTYSYLDDTLNDLPLKVEIWENYGVLPVSTIENQTQDTEYPYTNNLGPGIYSIVFYLYKEADPINFSGVFSWEYVYNTSITVLEYKIKSEWKWTAENVETGDVVINGILNNTSVTITGTAESDVFYKTYSYLNGNYYVGGILPIASGGYQYWIYNDNGTYYLMYYDTKCFSSNDLITWVAITEDTALLPEPTGALADGNIQGIMGWGNPSGTQWSDLNGTYVKTDVAVRPSGYYNGYSGMNTPATGTYNYYLQTENPDFNGIAYILPPGNTSGWFDPDNLNGPYIEPSVNYWRLMVGSDNPYCYFTNPSTDTNVFPLTGWVLVDNALVDTSDIGSNGYNYISTYGGGLTINSNYIGLNPEISYTYSPSSLLLNNVVCPVNPNFIPSIDYKVYKLVNKVWVETEDSNNFDLDQWDDETSSVEDIQISFQTEGFPIKIVSTITNCNDVVTYDTYKDGGYLITSTDALTLKAQVQTKGSYTIRFSYSFQDTMHPNLIITPENNAQCNVIIYKNEQIIYVYEKLEPAQNFSYTFDEATKENLTEYKVIYYSFNPDFPEEEIFDENVFIVREYKPTFELPTILCKQVNEFGNVKLDQLNFNCYSEDTELHDYPEPLFNPNIRYKLYYFNEETYEWDLDIDTDTPTLNQYVTTYLLENPDATDFDISLELQNKFYFGSDDTDEPLWKPERLAMAKLIVNVTNYTATVSKEVIFPICGSWKVRRMSCGSYRLYNYTANPYNFTLIDLKTETVVKILESFPFSYITFDILEDGVYKIVGIGTERYIFNFCAIENCVLELQKKVLLDDTLCDACKLDKVLYQKALRLIPIYETWKKLLDKDGVYDIQYLTTDVDKNLEEIYSADELYAELKLLCDQCTNEVGTKKCNC